MKNFFKRQKETINFFKKRIKKVPDIAVILGSSLGGLINNLSIKLKLSYKDIPNFKPVTAPGHKGNLIIAQLARKNILLMQGRHHFYEGIGLLELIYPIYILCLLGIKQFIFTSLVGGINRYYKKGEFVIITDHINLSGLNPLIHIPDKNIMNKFIDMQEAYSLRFISLLKKAAALNKIRIHKGVLAYLTGPTLETKAESRYLHILGADIIGWSIVPEVIVARYFGREVAGLSLVSDISNYRNFKKKKLDDIYRVGEKNTHKLFMLLETALSILNQ